MNLKNYINIKRDTSNKKFQFYKISILKKRINSATINQENHLFFVVLLLLLLLVSGLAIPFIKSNTVNAQEMQQGIASEIIRFHVIANSDSIEDQNLKIIVKDTLVKDLSLSLRDAKDILQAQTIITSQLTSIRETTEAIVTQNGFSYQVSVSLEPCYFPLKIYGDYTFPPGTYEALRVQIGEAKGKNWWCVMFPPLCFVDETYSIVDKESEEQLKYLLTEDEYETLRNEKAPIKIKIKLWESLKKLFK